MSPASDDFPYRSLYTFKIIDTSKIDFLLHAQARLKNNAKDLSFSLVSPQLRLDVHKNLTLGFNYTYLNTTVTNSSAEEEFKFHHRLELEFNPHWNLTEYFKLNIRNRMEFRWIEDKGSDNPRFRSQWTVEFPIKNHEPLKAFYTNSEFFYDMSDHRYKENWTVPAGLKFKVNDKTTLSVFYMIQSLLGSDDWSSNQILGSHLFVSFYN